MQDYQKRLALSLLAYAVQKNMDVEQLSAHAGIDISDLKADTGKELTSEQINGLWSHAIEMSRDSLFGLHFGESVQLAALGVVGELIRHSQTIGEAITHAAQFTGLITDLLTMEVERSVPSFTIRFVPNRTRQQENPIIFQQIMDFFMAFTLHEVNGLILRKICPLTVRLPLDDRYVAEYSRVFRCEAIQQRNEYAMDFDSTYWNEPIVTADYELQSVFLRKVSAMSNAVANPEALSERINSYLLANAYLGVPTLETIAANLNVSSRSLQRRLQEEGVTYQQLTDSIRKSLALHYVESGDYPIKEVSYILGYNELSAFSRAFRRWTGTTPVSYQKGYCISHKKTA